MASTAIDELDAAGVLAAADDALLRRRAAEVEDLRLIAHWADLHANDPRRGPIQRRSWNGEDRVVEIGGDGTPLVQELCLPELAIARRVQTLAVRAAMADVLDLRHRLPRTWEVVESLECEAWVARKVATMSRALDLAVIGIVDAAVAAAIAGESPSRVLELARAKVIEADPAAYASRLEEQLRHRFVSLSRIDDHGMQHVIAHVESGPALWVSDLVDRIADALHARRDLVPHLPADVGRDELRAEAFGWLAHPERVLELLEPAREDLPPRRSRARAVVHVHLHEGALHRWGVARVARSSSTRSAGCSATPTSSSSPSSTSTTAPGSTPTSTPRRSRNASTSARSARSSPTPPASAAPSTSIIRPSTTSTVHPARPATTTPHL
ncbi:hypothetical protein HIDPHFAB_04144 [Nocardioides sp. T2.26MG-1]|nr:hypothetical protein HIDPHFAB_04144 [Nocardioides sp. T2.26MG-1]